MLKEWDKSRGYRYYLLRRNIHVVKLVGRYLYCIVVVSYIYAAARSCRKNISLFINRSVGTADIVLVFVVGRKIDDLVRYLSVHNLTARADKETIFIYTCKCRKRCNKADIRSFRRFYGADSSIVSVVNVARFESGTLAAQTSGAESRKTASVSKLGKRVCLIHKLRKLSRTKELSESGRYRAHVDKILCHGCSKVGRCCHTLSRYSLHTQKTYSDLILKKLTHSSYSAVPQMVDIIHVLVAVS